MNRPNRLQITDPLVGCDVQSEATLEPLFLALIHKNVDAENLQNGRIRDMA